MGVLQKEYTVSRRLSSNNMLRPRLMMSGWITGKNQTAPCEGPKVQSAQWNPIVIPKEKKILQV